MDYFENMCTKEDILGNILASEQFFLLNARLWLWMMRLSSQAQQRPGKWLFSDGIKLHLS